MPNNNLTKISTTFLMVLLMLNGFGQNFGASQKCITKDWQINYSLGFTEFYGDVSSNGYFKKFSGEIAFATGFTVRKYFNPIFGLGANLWYTGFKSTKDNQATGVPTNFSVAGNYFDGNINLLIDFNSLFWGASNRKLSVYGIVGIGYSTWNSTLTDSLTGIITVSGDNAATGNYKKGAFVIPIGVGLNYMLSDNWALNFEMNLRTILNDDVDVWRDGFKYDQLLYSSIGISYFINKNKNKPKQVKRNDAPIKPVSSYDYRIINNHESSSKTSTKTIIIDQPVEKEEQISTGITYHVQIFATRNKISSFDYLRKKFNITGKISEHYQDGIYRYSTGSFSTYTEALTHSRMMKNKGINDAFVVAYKLNLRIAITPEMKNQ